MPCFKYGCEDSYPVWDMGFKGSHLCRPCFREEVDLDRSKPRSKSTFSMNIVGYFCLLVIALFIVKIIVNSILGY
jgi:hypothetical protein